MFNLKYLSFLKRPIALNGPVERINGELVMKISLASGGSEFIKCTRGLSRIEDDCIIIPFTDGAAKSIGIQEGSRVTVTIKKGRFTFFYDPTKE